MKKSVDLVFLWHMHQPDYRDYSTGDFVLPWTYLHAIKDYTDMAYHLEHHPKIRAVLNFVPILVDQLEDYVDQFATGTLRDPLLRLLAHRSHNDLTADQRHLLLDACFRSNHEKMVEPFPAYKRLMELHNAMKGEGEVALSYLSGQYMADLITWYHLAWCGESVRREYPLVVRLMQKGEGYTYQDRKGLLDLIGKLVTNVIPRYRKLAKTGQIEISATPHYHPLAPLMIDFSSAREAMPDVALPQSTSYPGGRERVAQHIVKAKKSHTERFGTEPKGMWPAEGSISDATLQVMAEEGCHWAASGQTVLVNSLRRNHLNSDHRADYLYRPYKIKGVSGDISCFFRDDNLSDLIGFEYARCHTLCKSSRRNCQACSRR
jgi:alpha-amylase/alpha-mannosidase (GH57 family)